MLDTMLRWGEADRRLQTLEALRGLVEGYKDEQRAERQSATLTGAYAWIAARDDATQPRAAIPMP